MAELYEQSKILGQKIRLYTTKQQYHGDLGAEDQSAFWRKQDFIAQVLLNADEQRYYAPDRKALQEIRDQFTNETKLEVNLDTLFEKQWLRSVTDVVYLPASIRGSIYSVKKIKGCRNELLFLKTIKGDREGGIALAEFEQLTEQYEQENNIKFSLEDATNAHLLAIENEKVKVHSTHYYNPVIDHWNEFLFFEFLYDRIYGNEANLIIAKDKLHAIHSAHSKNFTLTPQLSEMLASGLGIETPDGYVITLFEKRYCSFDTIDEAGAILWRQLNIVHKGTPRDQLLKLWCRKMLLKSSHNGDIYKHLVKGEKDQFNNAAIEVITREPDLQDSPSEYKKALLDHYMGRDLSTVQFAERQNNSAFSKDSKDAFDTMNTISNTQRGSTDDYLYFAQSSRETISYLLGQIVKSHSCEDFHMDAIHELTKGIHQKPYLVWTLCHWIWEWRPELVPSLMQNTEITSVLFSKQHKFAITPHIFESRSEINFKTASALFKHLLTAVQLKDRVLPERKAKIIFDCLLATETPQYQIKGQVPKLQREIQDAANKVANDIKHEFANRPNQYSIYGGHMNTDKKYYPVLLKDLFDLVTALTREDKYHNGTLDFHYEKVSLLLFLTKLSKDIPVEDRGLALSTYDLAKTLLDCYTTTISATSVMSLDYDTWKPKAVTPIFIPASQNIEAIDWGTAYLLLDGESLSPSFLRPANLTFNEKGDEYDNFNRFIMDKLRAHLKVLIVTYKQLKKEEANLKGRGIHIESAIVGLQNAILDIAIPYSLNDPSKHRFDIFNNIDERPSYGGRQGELIPQLGELSNYFDAHAREKLIDALLRTDSLVRVVKLAETMTSEQDQKVLLATLSQQKIAEELEKLYLNDIQFLLTTLSKYPQFQDKSKEVLSYWDAEIVTRDLGMLTNEVTASTYRTKLLLAFQDNDLQAIENVPEPKQEIYVNAIRLFPQNEKDFYRALYYFKNDDPKQAYSLFNDLVNRKDDDTTTVALNRFAAKLNWAEKVSDETKKNILLGDALNEWEAYQQNLPPGTSLEHIAESLRYNRLVVFDELQKHDEFDNAYFGLNQIDRMKPGFFEIGVRNKQKRKMMPEALSLIKEATAFHKLKDGTIPLFITKMNDLIIKESDPATISNLFSSLLGANPALQVQYIPASINDGDDPNSYILNCLVGSASNMLSRINSIAQVSHEDKYSDLMIMGLAGDLKHLHWHVSPARGGHSDSKLKNPGEIDFSIYAANNDELAICEALNLSGKNNTEVKKHSLKIFNYTPSKQGLFLIVYYKGLEKKFLSSWNEYKSSIQDYVDFPESYQFEAGSFVDSSDKHNKAAIRVGMSSHGNGIMLRHIFININYKATS